MKNSDRILVPYDFTDPADKALKLASSIALKNGMGISLLHINDQLIGDVDSKLKLFIGMFELSSKINFDYIIKQGKVISEISKVSADPIYKLMVIGSHGYKGFREKVMGADILKLVKDLSLPVIVIQKGYEPVDSGIKNIIMVQNPRESSQRLTATTAFLSKSFNTEIFQFVPETIEPKDRLNRLLEFAKSMSLPMISITSDFNSASQYLSKSEIESLLTNQFNIPILYTTKNPGQG